MCGGHGPRKKLSVFEPEREPTEPRMFLVKRLHNGTGTTRARERVAHTSEGGEGRLGACWVQCMRHARVRLEIVAEFRRSHLSRAAQDLLLTDGGRKNKSPQVPPLQERQLREERPQISSRVAAFQNCYASLPDRPTHRPTCRADRPAIHKYRLNQATGVLSVKLHPLPPPCSKLVKHHRTFSICPEL